MVLVLGIWIWYRMLRRDNLSVIDKLFMFCGVLMLYIIALVGAAILFDTPLWRNRGSQ